MGGDQAPLIVLDGIVLAAERHPEARFLLIGDESKIRPLMAERKRLETCCTLRHAEAVIGPDMKPTAALRVRQSSMRLAIDSVASGESAGLVSAGNTGALMALAKIVVKTLPGIDRPAMAAIAPTAKGDIVMLDLGANIQSDARNLVEFAVMGDVFARTVLGLTAPTIGLMNVGSEELKGDERVREAAELLRLSPHRAAILRVRRRSRHRGRHHGRHRHGRLHRQRRVEDRRVRAQADGRPAAPDLLRQPARPHCLPVGTARPWIGCASGSIPGATTAP